MNAENATQAIQSVTSNLKINAQAVLVGLVVAAAVSFGVAYWLYYIINRNLLMKAPFVFDETTTPRLGTELSKFYAGGMPGLANGRRMSFSFWIYVHDINKFKGVPRHVMHLGEETLMTSSPVVFIGPDDNKLYVAMKPGTEDIYPGGVTTTTQKLMYIAQKHGLIFDYLPIQRWVHVGVVINESVNGGSITGFMDGELVKTVTTGTRLFGSTTDAASFQNLLLDKRGSLYLGGSMADVNSGPGFSGLVSTVKFFNFDLNVKDMYNEYRKGPVSNGVLSRLGYGIRTPIYKTSEQ